MRQWHVIVVAVVLVPKFFFFPFLFQSSSLKVLGCHRPGLGLLERFFVSKTLGIGFFVGPYVRLEVLDAEIATIEEPQAEKASDDEDKVGVKGGPFVHVRSLRF